MSSWTRVPRPRICLNSVIEPNRSVEDDEPTRLRIDSSRQEPRRRHEDRELRLRVDEVAELVLTFRVVAGDPHDVPAVLGEEVWVLVDERLSHPSGVFLVDTEEDRLLEAVSAFLEELGDSLGDQLGAVIDDERPIEVLLVVDPVRDLLAFAVGLPSGRTVAVDVDVDVDIDDLVRREEAVLDALLERVGVDRLAEVVDVRDVLRLLRRRRQPDLGRRGEVLQDLPPSGVFVRASTVALVHDDEVEEAGRELTKQLLTLLWTR